MPKMLKLFEDLKINGDIFIFIIFISPTITSKSEQFFWPSCLAILSKHVPTPTTTGVQPEFT